MTPRRVFACLMVGVLGSLTMLVAQSQDAPQQFGGAYAALQPRRQELVKNWVARFTEVSGQKVEVGAFYDDVISLSSKTTFDAITHALMTTTLSDDQGRPLGDMLSIVARIDNVAGQIPGASGDRQFRMYLQLTEDAIATLEKSREFKRGADNTIFHKGFPICYRQQGGTPSIQVSIAPDGRRADIDVDYRSSSFPVAMFNGHLSSSNSDVRAGNNADRHDGRWSGLQSWWRGFFGLNASNSPDAPKDAPVLEASREPRVGKKDVDVMTNDFLTAWLLEGNAVAASAYVSDRAYSCMAQEIENPADFDRGMARFHLLNNLKTTHAALGPHTSLDGLTVGVRLSRPGLTVVTQPHHAQFVIYAVPDDLAAAFDCDNRLIGLNDTKARRVYGKYFGATFNLTGRQNQTVALLWARENGYWKIVSWQVGIDNTAPPADEPAVTMPARGKADATLAQAANDFVNAWFIKKQYDRAFQFLSTSAYGCFNLERSASAPAAASLSEAGTRLREGLQAAGASVANARSLDAIISAVEPVHPAIQILDHPRSRDFALSSLPNALADAMECTARERGVKVAASIPLEYGNAFGMTFRFRTLSGDAPVLRLMWRRENGAWRITSYTIEVP